MADTIPNTIAIDAGDAALDNLIKYAVAPRPICFASTVDAAGRVNLSPFSYFNLVSHNPPVCMFSPVRRMRDGTTKHTLDNIREVPEVVINIVDHAIVHQQSLASTEYPKGVDEFVKAGLTAVPSGLVAPPRVAESPVQLECRVRNVVDLGGHPGAGSVVLAEVLRMHVRQGLLDGRGGMDQAALDAVARLGGDWYCRVGSANLFELPKPLRRPGIGVDSLPEPIRTSAVLTGNHLAQLANVEAIPEPLSTEAVQNDPELRDVAGMATTAEVLHQRAAGLLDRGDATRAWQVLLLGL